MRSVFSRPDTVITKMKALEKRLFDFQKKGNYFFKYLQSDSDYRAQIQVTPKLEKKIPGYYEYLELNRRHPDLIPFEFDQIAFIELYHQQNGNASGKWYDYCIIMPNNQCAIIPRDRLNNEIKLYDNNGKVIETLPGLSSD